jgi:hypothetical protein
MCSHLLLITLHAWQVITLPKTWGLAMLVDQAVLLALTAQVAATSSMMLE